MSVLRQPSQYLRVYFIPRRFPLALELALSSAKQDVTDEVAVREMIIVPTASKEEIGQI